jgi:mRNA deadenylase 3'-5' endonuclease subunit Ccr4
VFSASFLFSDLHCTVLGCLSLSSMLRINLASNTNRSLLKVVLTADRANLKSLTTLAKDKLRLKGIKGFYKSTGGVLQENDLLEVDTLVLAHRGEEFVGKIREVPEFDTTGNSTLSAIPTCLERGWYQSGARARRGNIRILTFNILAPVLAQGAEASSEMPLGSPDDVDAVEKDDIHSSRVASGAHCVGVHYVPKPKGVRQLSHNFRCAQEFLAWPHRFPFIQSEVLQHDPDLVCLQEMDATAWPDCQHVLSERGYSQGVCSKALGGANNFVTMFWKTDKLQQVGEPEVVYLGAQGTVSAIIQRFHVCADSVRKKDFVALTTHLKAGLKEKSEQERAKELSDLCLVLAKFAGPEDDVVLCGDLNAHIEDLPFFGCGDEVMSPLGALVLPLAQKHGFRCAVREVSAGVPLPFSQWCARGDVEIKSTIDHILLRGPHIHALDALMAPCDSAVISAGCLPNERYPSDHIPVVVDVAFHGLDDGDGYHASALIPQREAPAPLDEKEVFSLGQELPQDGRVAITEDGFKYVELPKQWQNARESLQEAAAAFGQTITDIIASDRSALERHISRKHGMDRDTDGQWEFWSPAATIGLHISLGKHANALNVGKRVRFQVKKLLHFQSRKLGEPSQWSEGLFGARWFTFEVKLIDEVRCEGEEPHISFAVFGWRQHPRCLKESSA